MKPSFLLPSTVVLALVGSTSIHPVVDAMGTMIQPPPRRITDRYRGASSAMVRDFSDEDLLQMSIEDLTARFEASEFHANSSSSFDLNNGCRGTISEPENNVTSIGLLDEFKVEWNIKTPVPVSRGNLWVLKEQVVSGRIQYGRGHAVVTDFPMGDRVGPGSIQARLPEDFKWNECREGSTDKCVLQLKWAAANRTFVSCADIVVTTPAALSLVENIMKVAKNITGATK